MRRRRDLVVDPQLERRRAWALRRVARELSGHLSMTGVADTHGDLIRELMPPGPADLSMRGLEQQIEGWLYVYDRLGQTVTDVQAERIRLALAMPKARSTHDQP